jgi:hypothetical protein
MGVQVCQLFTNFKQAYDSVRREKLYSIFIGSGVPMKLVRLIKMCLNETYSKVHLGKHLSKYMLLYHQNAGQNQDIKIANRGYENLSQLKYLGTTVTIKI